MPFTSLTEASNMSFATKNILEALKNVKAKSKKRKFTQAIELVINLQNIDPKKAENRIDEQVELPHNLGKETKICVIASGEMALKARKAGADLIIERDELGALMSDKTKQKALAKAYAFFIAEAPLMPLVGRSLGSVLGPRGKMPTPVPPNADIKDQIKKHRKKVRLRMRTQPVLHCRVGTEDMADEETVENIQAVVKAVETKLKRGFRNIRSIHLKATMSPPVKIGK
jgi:large subunit ribosomal protein L1